MIVIVSNSCECKSFHWICFFWPHMTICSKSWAASTLTVDLIIRCKQNTFPAKWVNEQLKTWCKHWMKFHASSHHDGHKFNSHLALKSLDNVIFVKSDNKKRLLKVMLLKICWNIKNHCFRNSNLMCSLCIQQKHGAWDKNFLHTVLFRSTAQ